MTALSPWKPITGSLTPLRTSVLCNLKDHSGRSCFLLQYIVPFLKIIIYILLRCKFIYLCYILMYIYIYIIVYYIFGLILVSLLRMEYVHPKGEIGSVLAVLWTKVTFVASCHVHMEEQCKGTARLRGRKRNRRIKQFMSMASRYICLWVLHFGVLVVLANTPRTSRWLWDAELMTKDRMQAAALNPLIIRVQ